VIGRVLRVRSRDRLDFSCDASRTIESTRSMFKDLKIVDTAFHSVVGLLYS